MSYKLPETEKFALLANRRRRLTLQILQRSSAPLTAIELANRIGEKEYDAPATDDLRAIHLSLYHTHLPKLEGAEVVEYDEDDGTVYPGLNFDTLTRFLETVTEDERPWSDASDSSHP